MGWQLQALFLRPHTSQRAGERTVSLWEPSQGLSHWLTAVFYLAARYAEPALEVENELCFPLFSFLAHDDIAQVSLGERQAKGF